MTTAMKKLRSAFSVVVLHSSDVLGAVLDADAAVKTLPWPSFPPQNVDDGDYVEEPPFLE